jgi:hypothetical protein
MPACPVCNADVPSSDGPGRPRIYDRPACRRAAYRQHRSQLVKLGRALERALADEGNRRDHYAN